jgi:hypothetical protein
MIVKNRAKNFFGLLLVVYGLMLALIPLAVPSEVAPYPVVVGSLGLILAIPAAISAFSFLMLELVLWFDTRP